MEKEPEKKKLKPHNKLSNFVSYTNIGIQMLLTIALAVWVGIKADEYFGLLFPVFTIVLSILSLAGVLYYFVRKILNNT
ncbi:MAG: AtpZ/AtpI family protein [Cytophagaceae bacterium]|nr:AtpZ/AtpI family protein [Cytophagaceae bacterium]MDW8456683.1 AtpZ/AtpI family protein [Cytophagaceae bacterium]